MREIKFKSLDGEITTITLKERQRIFTGLLDKNGKEIYEGDIVKCLGGKEEFITQIIWELCGLRLKDTLLGNMHEGWGKDMEIIGDIYQNPELLK